MSVTKEDIVNIMGTSRVGDGLTIEVRGDKFRLEFLYRGGELTGFVHDSYVSEVRITKIPKMVDVYTYKSASEIIKLLEDHGAKYYSNYKAYVQINRWITHYLPVDYIFLKEGTKQYTDPAKERIPWQNYADHAPYEYLPVPEWMYTVSQEEEKHE